MCVLVSIGISAFAKETIRLTTITDLENPVVVASIKILRQAYGRLGYDLEISFEPLGRAVISANAGRSDGELVRPAAIRHEYPQLVQTRPPLFQVEFVALTTKKDLHVKNWEALKGYRLVAETGYKHVEYSTKGMNVIFVPNREQAFRMLYHDRADFVIMEKSIALRVLEKMAIASKKSPDIFEAGSLDKVPLYHFLNKTRTDLVPKINQVLAKMHEQGEIEKAWADEVAKIRFDIKKAK